MPEPSIIIKKLLKLLSSIHASEVLDVGCGPGSLTKILFDNGYKPTGIEPSEEAIKKASRLVPGAKFIKAGAQNIPTKNNSFDACVLVNSFHHIPQKYLETALDEFKRVLKPSGELIIIEPLTHGTFFEVMLPIEDETEIRNHALDVLQKVTGQKKWQLINRQELDRINIFDGVDSFIKMLVAVDPARQDAAIKNKSHIEELFFTHAETREEKFLLVQPHTIWRMKPVN